MPDPKAELIAHIEKQMDLFQTTTGKAAANINSVLTIILDSMGRTILAQYDEIQKLNMEIANLTPEPVKVKELIEESTDTSDNIPNIPEPDPTIT